jgi:hypothetical protein
MFIPNTKVVRRRLKKEEFNQIYEMISDSRLYEDNRELDRRRHKPISRSSSDITDLRHGNIRSLKEGKHYGNNVRDTKLEHNLIQCYVILITEPSSFSSSEKWPLFLVC